MCAWEKRSTHRESLILLRRYGPVVSCAVLHVIAPELTPCRRKQPQRPSWYGTANMGYGVDVGKAKEGGDGPFYYEARHLEVQSGTTPESVTERR